MHWMWDMQRIDLMRLVKRESIHLVMARCVARAAALHFQIFIVSAAASHPFARNFAQLWNRIGGGPFVGTGKSRNAQQEKRRRFECVFIMMFQGWVKRCHSHIGGSIVEVYETTTPSEILSAVNVTTTD